MRKRVERNALRPIHPFTIYVNRLVRHFALVTRTQNCYTVTQPIPVTSFCTIYPGGTVRYDEIFPKFVKINQAKTALGKHIRILNALVYKELSFDKPNLLTRNIFENFCYSEICFDNSVRFFILSVTHTRIT